MNKLLAGAAIAGALAVLASPAAALTITSANGGYSVGIAANGELFDVGPYIGMRRNADGFDPISPGTPRDSWGLNGAYADDFAFGSNGLSTIVTGGGAVASATATTADGFTVVMNYSFVGDDQNILKIATSVTNNGQAAQNALFQRDVDWDPQTTFINRTFGPIGSFALVADSSYYGFEAPAGDATYGNSCGASCDQTGDLGAGIRLNLGLLGVGQSSSFNYFYGLSTVGGDVRSLIGQAQGAGASFLLAGESTDGGTQSMILGVGAADTGGVPEPATWAMMLTGFFGVGGLMRRRQALTA